ncbi:MAG: Gfo/Idh/MocA family oxidoreductase [Thermoproteota archaeon]|nr:Gfo/Idh/MocA family oxidoreductase [Candidatus Brockarchaeota archaeon]
MTLRVGIIGCGGIANKHAEVLSRIKEISLVAFCDIIEGNAKSFNEKYAKGKANVYTDYTKMLEKERLDIVYICLPPFAHGNEVEIAAENHTNIFIEKPIALSLELAKNMVRVTEKYSVKTQVGFMSRFGSAVEYFKNLESKDETGNLVLFIGRYFCNSLHSPWWREKAKSGGQVVEQIIHLYDLSRYLMGEPKSTFSKMNNILHKNVENYTIEDVSASVIKFKNGSLATIAATNCAIPNKWIFDFHVVSKNYTSYFLSPNVVSITKTDIPWENSIEIKSDRDLYEAETLDLISAIKENKSTRTPMIEGARSLSLVLSVVKSAEENREVEVEMV